MSTSLFTALKSPATVRQSRGAAITRVALGITLATAGVGHLSFQRKDFQAQVPDWVPLGKDATVLASGGVEIALGTALIALPRYRRLLATVIAAFFVAVFPGNLHQYHHHLEAFGLDTDRKRRNRLFGQPILVLWALASGRDGAR